MEARKRWRGWFALGASLGLFACGGEDSSDLFNATSTGGAGGSSSASSSAGGASGTSSVSGGGGAGGTSGTGGSSGAAGGGTDAGEIRDVATVNDVALDRARVPDARNDAGCPDVFGSYKVTDTRGDCGNLNEQAPQSIDGTTQACALHFRSVVDGGGIGAVNGGAILRPDGTFSNAALILGTAMRNQCSGTWDENARTMTIACSGSGGPGGDCTVVLTRS
jgi:hypothetical protein